MSVLSLKELAVDVVEVGVRHRRGMLPCQLERNINFDLQALESFSSRRWQPTVYDVLVVGAAVEFCDRSLARGTMNWGRRFFLRVPVHDPDRWSDKTVTRALMDALNLLTGDDWHFEFYSRKVPAVPPVQDQMMFPSNVEAVIAFSDGMDSSAVAGLESKRLGKRLVCVRVGSNHNDLSKKERLRVPFKAFPYVVKLDGGRNAETSARSRGFKFSIVSAMAAYLTEAPSAIVPESGQGALGPVLLPVGHGYEDYRNYPAFAVSMERFVDALLNYKLRYQFPRLWMTKGETLREFLDNCGSEARWTKTRSCWQQSRQSAVSGKRRQCGICAACILRRLSVHAAGLSESSETYVWESLQVSDWKAGAATQFSNFTSALREYAIAGVLHFEHLSSIRESVQYELIKRRRTNELARSLQESAPTVEKNLDRLLQQHAMEWSSFTDELGQGSFLRKWIDASS